MPATETFRPNTADNTAWTTSSVANIDDAVSDPSAGDGSAAQALLADDGQEQLYGFPSPAGTDYSHCRRVTVKLYAKGTGGSPKLAVRANVGQWSTTELLTLTSSYAWYSAVFAFPSASRADLAELQVGLTPHAVGTSVEVDVLYCVADGVNESSAIEFLSWPEDNVAALLAESTAWQVWTASRDSDEAAGRIYTEWSDVTDLDSLMPLAVVGYNAAMWNSVYGGSQNYLRPSGSLYVHFMDHDRYPDDIDASRLAFRNFLGEVVKSLAEEAGTADNLSVHSLSVEEIVAQVPESGQNYWSARVQVGWGDTP